MVPPAWAALHSVSTETVLSATPERIRQITRDHVVVTAEDLTVKALHRRARPTEPTEPFETFYDDPADAQVFLDVRFAKAKLKPRRFAVEVDDDLDIGGTFTLVPELPRATCRDDFRGISSTGDFKSYAIDGSSDRSAIEVMG